MRPWAHWTARTAVVAVGLAAASDGLSGVALAGTAHSYIWAKRARRIR